MHEARTGSHGLRCWRKTCRDDGRAIVTCRGRIGTYARKAAAGLRVTPRGAGRDAQSLCRM